MMHRFLATICALAYLVSATVAQAGFVINSYTFAAPANPSISFIGCVDSESNTNAFTFSATNVGTAGTRHTIMGITGEDAATVFGVDSVIVGGDAATEAEDQAGAGSLVDAAIYIVSNPVGTSEDIVVTFSEAITSASVCVWAAYDLLSATKVASDNDFNSTSVDLTLDHNTSALGVSVAICATEASASWAWSGMSERVEGNNTELGWSAADFTEDASASTPLGINCNPNGATDLSGAAASFR